MNKLPNFIIDHSNNKWNEYVNDFIIFIKDTLLTYEDFKTILNKIILHPNSKVLGLQFEIKSNEKKTVVFRYQFNTESSSDKSLDTEYLDSHNWFNFEYSIWYGNNVQKDGTAKDEVKSLIKLLINTFWKASFRHEKTRIWTKLVPDTGPLINSTLTYYKNKCHYITILYCDLDKFKALNDTHGGSAGDGVLLQMADFFTSFIVDEPAILIHDKGDEFIILIFTMHIEDALSIAYRFQQRLKIHTFEVNTVEGIQKVESEVTVGINIRHTLTNDDISFSTEIQYAEQAIKDDSGHKRYGIANLYNSDKEVFEIAPLSEFTINGSKLNLKVGARQYIFRNVWLNLIAELAQQTMAANGSLAEIQTLLDWIKPVYTANCSSFYEYTMQPDYTKDISSFDVLIAIARGIITFDLTNRSERVFSIKSFDKKIALFSDNEELFQLPSEQDINLEIGTFFKGNILPVALLVKIGHKKLSVPEHIFSKIIIVDDRPSKGGGLPDFWELALAKVVNQVKSNPNIRIVYIIGERQYGSNTVQWLEKIANTKIEQQDIETLTYKISATHSAIDATQIRLKDAVMLYDSIEPIAKAYADFVTNGKDFDTKIQELGDDRPLAFLQKDVRINDYALSVEDGFKVKTLTEAYPLMLEVARLSTGSNNIRDQARGLLGELIDFKVELSNPTRDLIPFYYRADKKKFEDYFNTLFIQPEGLFAKHLNTQLDAVLKHIEESITTEEGKQYSTRRAILIIPNQISGDDLMPLGLVSLRIIPRFKNPKSVELIFSYTWRTVEALVGFPYSLYGSIRYGESLQAKIQERVSSKGISITFDKVSYIANSLHIFMDEQGQAIAKSIINEASI